MEAQKRGGSLFLYQKFARSPEVRKNEQAEAEHSFGWRI